MKIIKFNIKNYKGINEATIKLNGNKGTIYTLVGLNESGKTTILEAINTFKYDVDGIHAIAQKSISTTPVGALVPKKKKDNFNDTISVSATVTLEQEEIKAIASRCKKTHGFQIAVDKFPDQFTVSRILFFENSAHTHTATYWSLFPNIKKYRGRSFKAINNKDKEWKIIVREIGILFPRIVYFPTFLFDFPEKIKISPGEADFEGNEYFRRLIEDALLSLDDPLNLQTHIVGRIFDKEPELPFGEWVTIWMESDERERVTTALNKLSQRISTEIFGRWKEVLGSDIGQKEIVIEHTVEPGENNEREVFLTLKIKDGYTGYKISERSLGFRWFFCFLLFTRFFRGNESGESIFLFDEPASNLHSKAQSKLLDSLNVIASGKNDVIYSTHSHHLINPLWLETTYIITNGEPTTGENIEVDVGVEDTDIQAQFYKTFVGKYPEHGHYFQPILDKLQVSASMLEAIREGVFTEGKSDFYILNWYKKYHKPDLAIDFFPIGGATNAKPLMSLYLGLAHRFVFLLDSDREGQRAKKEYLNRLPIQESQVLQVGDVFQNKHKEIEDLISTSMKKEIAKKYNAQKINKKHILRAFSTALSSNNDLPSDIETLNNLDLLTEELKRKLQDEQS